MLVVEACFRKTLEVLVDEEVVQKARIALIHQHEPGQAHGQQQEQAGQRQQAPQSDPVALPDQPHKQYSSRQHDADQPLGEQAERSKQIGQQDPGLPRQARFCLQHGMRGGKNGAADQSGNQHVQVGILRASEQKGHGGQHGQGPAGLAQTGMPQQKEVHAHAHQPGAQYRGHARHPGIGAEQLERSGVDPVEQRRLVEEGQAIEQRHGPVAADGHFQGNAGVTPFVRHGQRAPGGGAQQPGREQQCWPQNRVTDQRMAPESGGKELHARAPEKPPRHAETIGAW